MLALAVFVCVAMLSASQAAGNQLSGLFEHNDVVFGFSGNNFTHELLRQHTSGHGTFSLTEGEIEFVFSDGRIRVFSFSQTANTVVIDGIRYTRTTTEAVTEARRRIETAAAEAEIRRREAEAASIRRREAEQAAAHRRQAENLARQIRVRQDFAVSDDFISRLIDRTGNPFFRQFDRATTPHRITAFRGQPIDFNSDRVRVHPVHGYAFSGQFKWIGIIIPQPVDDPRFGGHGVSALTARYPCMGQIMGQNGGFPSDWERWHMDRYSDLLRTIYGIYIHH